MTRLFLAMTVFAGVFAFGSDLRAEHTVIYVHGMKFENYTHCQGMRHWNQCRARNLAGQWKRPWVQQRTGNVYHVGYDGRADPHPFRAGRGRYQVYKAFSAKCRGRNTCEVVCGSMGCHATADALSTWPNSFNVIRVMALASGEGGSDLGKTANNVLLAVAGRFASHGLSGVALFAYLKLHKRLPYGSSFRMRPEVARNTYTIRTGGTQFYHKVSYHKLIGFALRKAGIMPGRNDFVSAHHSTCGYGTIKPFRVCGGERMRVRCLSKKWRRGFRICVGRKKTYRPWPNHHAGRGVSREGVKGKLHGYFSKHGGGHHYFFSR